MNKKHKKKKTNIKVKNNNSANIQKRIDSSNNSCNNIVLSQSELNDMIKKAIKESEELKEKPLTSYSQVMLIVIGIIYSILYSFLTPLIGYMVYINVAIPEIVPIVCFDGVIIVLGYAVFKKDNCTNSNIDKHFSLLTTIIAIILAIISLR